MQTCLRTFDEDEEESRTAFRAAGGAVAERLIATERHEEDEVSAWQSLLKSLDLDATKLEKEVLAVATTGRS